MQDLSRFALITGASSGFGKDFAYELATKGYNLILVGRREELLLKIKQDIEMNFKVNVIIKLLELTDDLALDCFIEEIKNNYKVEYLINNAGYGGEASFLDNSIENNMKMVKVHINATVKLTHAFAQDMKERNCGYIINVSSLAAFLNTTTAAMYCSTKAFIKSFTETLALELSGSGVKLQVLCPGFARTDFHSKLNMKEDKLRNRGIVRWMKSKDVVLYSLKMMDNSKKIVVIPGFLNRLITGLLRFVPKGIYYKIMILASKSW